MTWFRRLRDEAGGAGTNGSSTKARPADAAGSDAESPEALRRRVFDLVRHINANSGQLPGQSVVTARRITDTLREVIDTSESHPLDVYTVVSLKGMLTDYLPTTLAQFVALDPQLRDTARPSGRIPTVSLQEQLDSMLDAAFAVLAAAQAQDADALLAQGSFLRTKFSRSDLDL